ncbi:hypothetical protein ACWCOV_12060 [Kribbella sp. NPDC002412]
MSRRRTMTLEQIWSDRLGTEAVSDELAARFEFLSRFVLGGEMPPAGRLESAEAATAYGDLCVLSRFLTDARRTLTREGVEW